MNKLEKAILKTIAIFNSKSQAATVDQIWQFLHLKTSRVQVLIDLQNLEKEGQIEKKDELYFLADHVKILKKMAEQEEFLASRWAKVNRMAKILAPAPFTQNISITGSLAEGTSTEESEINLLVVAKKNRAWLAKIFLSAILEAFGQNKSKWYRAGKFSLDMVLDESDLALNKRDFPASSLANLTPVLDRGAYRQLIESNAWIFEELPNWQEKNVELRSRRYSAIEKFLLSEKVLKLWERLKKFEKVENWRNNREKGVGVDKI